MMQLRGGTAWNARAARGLQPRAQAAQTQQGGTEDSRSESTELGRPQTQHPAGGRGNGGEKKELQTVQGEQGA